MISEGTTIEILMAKLKAAESVVAAAEYTVLAMEWENTDLNNAIRAYRSVAGAGH